MYKLERFFELMELMDNAFIHKLREKNPKITDEEIQQALKEWYLTRPGAEDGDGEGVKGDINRFNK